MPPCPSLLRATVAPACGFPVVRLMTVPVTAPKAGADRINRQTKLPAKVG
jgi:hypothetical protein